MILPLVLNVCKSIAYILTINQANQGINSSNIEKVKLLDTDRYYSVRKQVNNVKAHACFKCYSPSPRFFGDKYPKL